MTVDVDDGAAMIVLKEGRGRTSRAKQGRFDIALSRIVLFVASHTRPYKGMAIRICIV